MTELLYSNEALNGLRLLPKRVTNPRARRLEKPGRHRQPDYAARPECGEVYRICQRQNLDNECDYSCGLALVRRGGRHLSLVRYNGSSHVHGEIRNQCHVHLATAEALAAGMRIDRHAKKTDRYRTLEEAFACLIEDCAVSGVSAGFDVPDLLDGS